MKLKIDPLIFNKFPEAKIGVLVVRDISNTNSSVDFVSLLRSTEEFVRKNYTLESVINHPKIVDWRNAYRSFGFKPSEYRCSLEALLRRVLNNKEIPSINPLVDIYNVISLKYLLPAGGGNVDSIEGNMNLTFAQGNERFVMLGQTNTTSLIPGEVIYQDNKDVLCRAWNYRESEKSKIKLETKNAYFILEGLQNTSLEEIEQGLEEMANLMHSFNQSCTSYSYILDKCKPL